MRQEVYSPRSAKLRLGLLALLLASFAWAGWAADLNPFLRMIGRGVSFVLLLFVPFLLKELYEALRHDRVRREQMQRAYTPSGRHDTGLASWHGEGDAPDNWQ